MTLRVGVLTGGGDCPGLNAVIRAVTKSLIGHGPCEVLGIADGFEGLMAPEPVVKQLTWEAVSGILHQGGTILGTSNSANPLKDEATLAQVRRNVAELGLDVVVAIGGDGTMSLAHALAQRVGLTCVGVPKTIDNDVPFVSRTFGYLTAIEEATKFITGAHTEAHSVHNGISLVKIMGRHAGFIAAGATVASQEVNFTLVPEMPFKLEGEDGFLAALKRRVERRAHAVILVAEGAGQHLMNEGKDEFDASGNVKFKDIGPFLREKIETYMKAEDVPYVIRYMDPSYIVRSVPASAEDAILCDFYARNAVHAAMAGKTGLVIGQQHDVFTHVPSELLTKHKKQLSLNSTIWRGVLACTGQNFASVA